MTDRPFTKSLGLPAMPPVDGYLSTEAYGADTVAAHGLKCWEAGRRAGLEEARAAMTDRDLLEKAAKAAGIEFDGEWDSSDRMSVRGGGFWNPLVSEADALRLVVTLGLRVYVYSTTAMEPGHTVVAGEQPGCHANEGHGDDALAATRRAIVRAAAGIAKAMP